MRENHELTVQIGSGERFFGGQAVQFDHGLKLRVKGLNTVAAETNPLPQFHFSNNYMETAYIVLPEVDGSDFVVSVPDVIMMHPRDFVCYIYTEQEAYGITNARIDFKITPRQRPLDPGYTPEQISNYDILVSRVIRNINWARAWATGTYEDENGEEHTVESADEEPYGITYQNNSLYHRGQAEFARVAAETAQSMAEGAQAGAERAEAEAIEAKEAAQAAQGFSEAAQGAAEEARDDAETAQAEAEEARDDAQNAAQLALTAQGGAEAAEDAAQAAQNAAEEAEAGAIAAENEAKSAEREAGVSARLAEEARDAAESAQADTWVAANEAEISRGAAADAADKAQLAQDLAERAQGLAEEAKEIAVGARNDAVRAAEDAEDYADAAERWAVGQIGGIDVPSTDETYQNNSKWYARLARDDRTATEQIADGLQDVVDDAERASGAARGAAAAAELSAAGADDAARRANSAAGHLEDLLDENAFVKSVRGVTPDPATGDVDFNYMTNEEVDDIIDGLWAEGVEPGSGSGEGDTPAVGVRSYNQLEDKPSINSVTLVGDTSLEALGAQEAGEYMDTPMSNQEILAAVRSALGN